MVALTMARLQALQAVGVPGVGVLVGVLVRVAVSGIGVLVRVPVGGMGVLVSVLVGGTGVLVKVLVGGTGVKVLVGVFVEVLAGVGVIPAGACHIPK